MSETIPCITVTIRLPDGYATGQDFADDCGFQLVEPEALTSPQESRSASVAGDGVTDEMVEAAAKEFQRHAWPGCSWDGIHESGRARYRNAARDGLIAALSAPPARIEQDGWQLMDTAPKGDQLWGWTDDRGSNPMIYCPDGVWRITYDDTEIEPTHWMPLPGAPASLPASGRDLDQRATEQSSTPIGDSI